MSWAEIKTFFASLTLQKLIPVVLIVVVGLIAVKLLLRLFDRGLERSKLDRTMFAFVRTIMRVLLYSLLVLIAARSFPALICPSWEWSTNLSSPTHRCMNCRLSALLWWSWANISTPTLMTARHWSCSGRMRRCTKRALRSTRSSAGR